MMKEEQLAGNELFVVRCKGALLSCHANLKHHPLKCARCVERSNHFFHLLDIPDSHIFDIKEIAADRVPHQTNFQNTDELLQYTFEGNPLGRGVASTIISRSRELEIDSTRYGELIDVYLHMAIQAYTSLKEVIEKVKPDRIYVYNGRQPEDRPMILLAEKLGIEYTSYVSGSSLEKFRSFNNGVVHYLRSFQQDIDLLLSNPDLSENEIDKEGAAFFNKVSSNSASSLPDYTRNQQKGLLPTSWQPELKNIAIFNSSEDEMKTFEDWKTHLYRNQNEGVRKICESFLPFPEVKFYLRIHPNLNGLNNSQMKELAEMRYPNLEIINADDPVSTYSLMSSCDKVITFGSSTGAEATHMGKVSILVGKSFYDHLDCVYKINNYEELVQYVLDDNLPAKPAFNARKYGYYFAHHGKHHRFLEFRKNGHYIENQRLEGIRFPLLPIAIKMFATQFFRWRKMDKLIRKYGF